MIIWTPLESQVGTHSVNISLTDGYETVYTEFDVEVSDKEVIDDTDGKGSSTVLIAIIIVVVILILAGIVIGLFFYMNKKSEKESTENEIEDTSKENTGPTEEEKQLYEELYGNHE
jgi:hypothetical protein